MGYIHRKDVVSWLAVSAPPQPPPGSGPCWLTGVQYRFHLGSQASFLLREVWDQGQK